MTMTTKNNENRTGIYVQESVGVTTAGDGLGPRGDKSPVAQNYDNTLNISHSQEQIYRRNPFNRNTSPLSEIVGGGSESDTNDGKPNRSGGSESDTNDGKPNRNREFRNKRNKQMKKEFLKLGFSKPEIYVMKEALDAERKQRHNQNKMLRYCEETNMDPETARKQWVERKERELAKFRAEKAAKIAAGTFNPIPFRDRKRQRRKDRSSPGSSGHFSRESNIPRSIDQSKISKLENQRPFGSKIIFTSPAILAGVREEDCPSSVENRRKAGLLMKQMEFGRSNEFEEVRRRMGLYGKHIMRRYSSDSLPEDQDCSDNLESQTINAMQSKYPIEVAIINKSHPFGEIPDETRFLILDALETTVQDERASGAHWIKISPGHYKGKRLHVNCRNIETVRFLESKVPLYNRLWREADLFVTTEKIIFKRSKYKVNFPNYHLTSDEFLKIIKKQNGFPTEHWTLYYKARENNRFKAFFGVDPLSAKRLEESDGYVYFFFDRIQFSLHEKLNKHQELNLK